MDWQPIIETIETINQDLTVSNSVQNLISSGRNEKDIISCFLNSSKIRHFLTAELNKLPKNCHAKNDKQAKIYKKKANREFKLKRYDKSIYFYTKTMQYAVSESEDYFQAAAYRSASLFHLEKYEESLQDVQLITNWQYTPELGFKLHRQAARCFSKINQVEGMKESFCEAKKCLQSCSNMSKIEKDENLRLIDLEIENLKTEVLVTRVLATKTLNPLPTPNFGFNQSFASASNAIDKKFEKNKGRFVVANRDIERKDILFVEKPFAFVLLNTRMDSTCANCCRSQCLAVVPCLSCSHLVYCSINCRDNAWSNYHRWECPGSRMTLWQVTGIAHLAMNVFLNCATSSDIRQFNEIQSLVTNIDKVLMEDLLVYCVMALMLKEYLRTYTSFFSDINLQESFVNKFTDKSLDFDCDISTNEGQDLYISSMLLRFILQMICNGHAITSLTLHDSGISGIEDEQQVRVATAIYPSASMMNHSCDANIINSFVDQYLIIKATRDIPKGDEIFNCYGPHFRRMHKKERKASLRSQYYFDCQCLPCTDQNYEHFLERFKSIKCRKCGGAFCQISSKCLDCEITCVMECESGLEEAERLFQAAQLSLQANKMEVALDQAKRCLSIRRNILYKHNENVARALDLIGKIHATSGHYIESIKCLEESLMIIEERFGSDSLEIAAELNKVTDICILYLQSKSNVQFAEYKSVVFKTMTFLERAQEILDLNNGPWSEQYKEILEKKEELNLYLKMHRLYL